MGRRAVHPTRRRLRTRAAETAAERDVGGRVLVEQRVVVDAAGLADARGGVDERDLAEPPPIRSVSMNAATKSRSSSESASSRTSRPLENSPRSPWMSRPRNESGNVQRNVPLVARASGLVKTSSVGMFGAMLPAVHERLRAAEPARAGDEAEVELRAGAAQLEPGQAELRQLRRAAARACAGA